MIKFGFFHAAPSVFEPTRCPCQRSSSPADEGAGRSGHAIAIFVRESDESLTASTLESLGRHVLGCFSRDTFVFHVGAIPEGVREAARRMGQPVRFHRLVNGSDHWLVGPLKNGTKEVANRYAAARWAFIGLFDFLHERGYEWVMSVFPGARFLSCVHSDPFRQLEANGHAHGYRVHRQVFGKIVAGMPELLLDHARREGLEPPPHLLSRFKGGNVTSETWDRRPYDMSFMVTKVAFWRSKKVRSWLLAADRARALHASGLQTLTLLMFTRDSEIHRFQDWSYLCAGALGVALHSLVPSALAGLLPEHGEWAGDLNELKEDPRYRHEATWLFRNIMTPVNRRQYWVFRILKYVR